MGSRLKMKQKITSLLVILCSMIFIRWGNVGHRIINGKATLFFRQKWISYFIGLMVWCNMALMRIIEKAAIPAKKINIISTSITSLSLFQLVRYRRILIRWKRYMVRNQLFYIGLTAASYSIISLVILWSSFFSS